MTQVRHPIHKEEEAAWCTGWKQQVIYKWYSSKCPQGWIEVNLRGICFCCGFHCHDGSTVERLQSDQDFPLTCWKCKRRMDKRNNLQREWGSFWRGWLGSEGWDGWKQQGIYMWYSSKCPQGWIEAKLKQILEAFASMVDFIMMDHQWKGCWVIRIFLQLNQTHFKGITLYLLARMIAWSPAPVERK
jgi:hypothetical protein